MLKILIEFRVQVFRDNFFGFFFVLMSFGLYYIGLMAAHCAFLLAEKVCVCVSVF